jgi:hypothetical protein
MAYKLQRDTILHNFSIQQGEACMPYTVMVWLTNSVDLTLDKEDEFRSMDQERRPVGGNSGVTIPPVLNRFLYGLYQDESEAQSALQEISSNLQQNAPLHITQRSGEVFVVPASRIHYVACAEVSRPKDQDNPQEGGAINQ